MTNKIILFALGLFCSFNAVSQHDVNFYGTKYTDIPLDTLPVYPGGKDELMKSISLNFRVNQSMKDQVGESVHRSLLTFVVDTSGFTSEFQIQNCPNSYVEKEFRRVVTSLRWEPAIQNGKKVRIKVDLMFNFILKSDQLIYVPQNDQVVKLVEHKKRPAAKITMITLALGIPIIAIIMTEKK